MPSTTDLLTQEALDRRIAQALALERPRSENLPNLMQWVLHDVQKTLLALLHLLAPEDAFVSNAEAPLPVAKETAQHLRHLHQAQVALKLIGEYAGACTLGLIKRAFSGLPLPNPVHQDAEPLETPLRRDLATACFSLLRYLELRLKLNYVSQGEEDAAASDTPLAGRASFSTNYKNAGNTWDDLSSPSHIGAVNPASLALLLYPSYANLCRKLGTVPHPGQLLEFSLPALAHPEFTVAVGLHLTQAGVLTAQNLQENGYFEKLLVQVFREATPPNLPADAAASTPQPPDRSGSFELSRYSFTLSLQAVASGRSRFGSASIQLTPAAKRVRAVEHGMVVLFWFCAGAVFERLSLGDLPPSAALKETLSRVGKCFKFGASRLSEIGRITPSLLRELIFFSLHQPSEAVTDSKKQIFSAFWSRLPHTLQQRLAILGELDSQLLDNHSPAAWAEAQTSIKTLRADWGRWTEYLANPLAAETSHDTTQLTAQTLSGLMFKVQQAFDQIFKPAQTLTAAMCQGLRLLEGNLPPPAFAIEFAAAGLYLELLLDVVLVNPKQLSAMQAHSQTLADRLIQSLQAASPMAREAWMDELFKQEQNEQSLSGVLQSLQVGLQTTEAALDAYKRDPRQASSLGRLLDPLAKQESIFAVLGLPSAVQTLGAIRRDVTVLKEPAAEAVKRELFDRVIHNVGQLGVALDMLIYQPAAAQRAFEFDPTSQRLSLVVRALFDKNDPINAADAFAVPTAKAKAKETAEFPIDLGSSNVPPLDTSTASSRRQDEAEFGDSQMVSFDLDSVLDFDQPLLKSPLPAASGVGHAQSDVPFSLDKEAELFPVFFEEMDSLLPNLGRNIDRLSLSDSPPQTLETSLAQIKRDFHTLKGSARMAGLMQIGDCAWRVEAALNAWFGHEAPDRTELKTALQPTVAAFGEVFRRMRGHSPEQAPTSLSMAPMSADGLEAAFGADIERLREVCASAAQAIHVDLEAFIANKIQAVTAPLLPQQETLGEEKLTALLGSLNLDLARAPEAQLDASVRNLSGELRVVAADPVQDLGGDGFAAQPAEDQRDKPLAVQYAPASTVRSVRLNLDEQTRHVGHLTLDLPIYNAFLQETDDWSRQLQSDLAECAYMAAQHQLAHTAESVAVLLAALPDRLESAIFKAHALAGSALAIGYDALGSYAKTLEDDIAQYALRGYATDMRDRFAVWQDAAEDIRSMLLQFAAGFLKEAPSQRLFALKTAPRTTPATASSPAQDQPPTDADAALADAVDLELREAFYSEAQELCSGISRSFQQWQKLLQLQGFKRTDAVPPEASAILRSLHTVKGGARLVAAYALADAAHALETEVQGFTYHSNATLDAVRTTVAQLAERGEQLRDILEATLQPMRGGQVPVRGAFAQGHSFVSTGFAKDRVRGFEQSDAVPQQILHIPSFAPETQHAQQKNEPTAGSAALQTEDKKDNFQPQLAAPLVSSADVQHIRIKASVLDQLLNQAGEVLMTRAKLAQDTGAAQNTVRDLGGNLETIKRHLRELSSQAEAQIQAKTPALRAATEIDSAPDFDPLELDRFTRLQELTRLITESVSDVEEAQRSLERSVQSNHGYLAAQEQQAKSLQQDLMRARMVTFDHISERLHRVVRVAAEESGKEVVLDILGQGFSVERSILERSTAAFEHLLRNAVAHGVETPQERLAAGKPKAGRITVAVKQEANTLRVDFKDDGAGLNYPKIAREGIARGWLSAEHAHDTEKLQELLFQSRFSTKSEVTTLSGRGVGLDVVRDAVRNQGGGIEIQTLQGKGTTFSLLLPLVTALTQITELHSGSLRIGLPANLIDRVVRVDKATVIRAHSTGWLELSTSQQSVPFYWLGALLKHSPAPKALGDSAKSASVVLVRSTKQTVAVHVDHLVGNQEALVKSLSGPLLGFPGLLAAGVKPNGESLLIYNPVALALRYGAAALAWTQSNLGLSAAAVGLQAIANNAADIQNPNGRATDNPLEKPWSLSGAEVLKTPEVPQPDTAALEDVKGASSGGQRAPSKKYAVMVVDDSLTVRKASQRLLERAGFDVLLANDGLHALELLALQRPALILSDIEMPRMDGFDLLRNIRNDATLASLPVIFITSRLADKHKDLAISLGVNGYLGKPYQEQELLALMTRLGVTQNKDAR